MIKWTFLLFMTLACCSVPTAHTATTTNTDWPQWLGPCRDGSYPGTDLTITWPVDGPKQRWRYAAGEGFSGPVVMANRLILFHRKQNKEIITCLNATLGTLLWEYKYPTDYMDDFGFDKGPRATPAIHDGFLYTFGAEGMLHCMDMRNGTKLWHLDTREEFGAPKGFFGMACSPLLEGDALLLNIGGKNGAGIIALHRQTGRLLWKATDAETSYSSPATGVIQKRRLAFFLNREGLVALHPANGRIAFEFPWRPSARASVSAATPLIIHDNIFISTSYGRGAALLLVQDSEPKPVWTSEEALSNHYATSLHHNGFLFGFHGRQEQGCELRCVELNTGEIQWSHLGLSAGSLILTGQQLLILTEKGLLISAPATPKAFKPSAQAQILGFQTRAYPALARGLFYARDTRQLICLDLRAGVSP